MGYKDLIKGKLGVEHNNGLMTEVQYLKIGELLELNSPCNFLVFGLGNDSLIWNEINKDGKIIFLEDDMEWCDKFKDSGLNIHNIKYTTKIEDWESIKFNTDLLKLDLPQEVMDETWDVILVDAPLGHQPPKPYKGPGRMQSIYMASQLLRVGGVCIVDDWRRQVEKTYGNYFFGSKNLSGVVEEKVAFYRKESE